MHGIHYDLKECNGILPNEFVNAETFIEAASPAIMHLALQLAQGRRNPCEKCTAFYNYIGDNMRYSGYNPNDVGALKSLESLSGDCSEFSDLMAALCRAAGIPAKTVEGLLGTTDGGYVEGENKHDWLEVYLLGSGWVPMDPTLGRMQEDHGTYFAGMTPDHIIVTQGRNPSLLMGYHFYTYKPYHEDIGVNLADEETWSIHESKG